MSASWIIWSEEHGRWWGPGGWGYTDELAKAGRYSEAEARKIERQGNIPTDPPAFKEIAIPDRCRHSRQAGRIGAVADRSPFDRFECCTFCHGVEFDFGPRGGAAVNVTCQGCGAQFNIVDHPPWPRMLVNVLSGPCCG